ncbi:MAG TPA: hypothetical protein VFG30_33175 [Polyangiales bacterium]|jgi:hypothetical protein|nr:hypothetical protein [Polyangiales bacterium]
MSNTPSNRPSARPSSHPSSRPSYAPPPYEPPSRSIKPSEPRSRAIFAGICLTLFGALVFSAFVRACEGDEAWEEPKQTAPKQAAPDDDN